jgi:agmatine deiminase
MKSTRRTMLRNGIALVGLALSHDKSSASSKLSHADFEMPPETVPHLRTFMQWPVSIDVYGERLLKRVQASIAEIAQAISRYEDVIMLVSKDRRSEAAAAIGGGIKTWDVPTDDLWCRDSGPTFVNSANGQQAVSHIAFNGWGNKQTYVNDGKIAARVAGILGLPLLPSGLKGEQGGLEHDGAGLVLAHASSWVNPNRNSGTADVIAQQILAAVGGKKMIWAPGISGADITDYHIDALARFVGPGKLLIQLPAKIDKDDPWSISAFETYEILKSATAVDGSPLDIVVLQEPKDIRSQKRDFVASYVNFYVCNGAVICSNFGDKKADGAAREMLQQLYPGREIVALNTDPIGESGGGIHCATQQQPRPEV